MMFSPDTVSGQFKTDAMDWVREIKKNAARNVNRNAFLHICRTMQNYLIWQLIIDRVSSLSRRFKDARARYRKVCGAERSQRELMQTQLLTVCVHLLRLSMEPQWRTLGGENVSDMSKAAWRMQLEPCTCARRLQGKVNKWWVRLTFKEGPLVTRCLVCFFHIKMFS